MSKSITQSTISKLVIAAIALGNAGSTLYLPAFPIMAEELHTSNLNIQLTLSCFLIGFSFSQLLYGPLSDAFGRKINLLVGLIIFCIGSLICMLTPGITLLIIGRLIQGIGIGSANAVGYALMRDIYLGHTLTKQLSYVSIFVGITPLIAPLMGGYIVQYGNWRGCFGLLLILAVFLLFLKFRYLPETLVNKSAKAHHPSVMLKNYQSLLRNKACIGPIVIASFAFSGLLTMGSLLPFLVIKELHFNPSTYGWIAGIPALAYLSGSFLVGQFGSKFCFSHLVIFGTGLGCISMGLALFFNWHSFDLVSLLIPLFGYLFGIGCIIPRASAEALSIVPHLTGSAAALLCACMFGVSACMIGIGSHLNQTSPIALFSLLLFTVFCTALTLIYSQRNV